MHTRNCFRLGRRVRRGLGHDNVCRDVCVSGGEVVSSRGQFDGLSCAGGRGALRLRVLATAFGGLLAGRGGGSAVPSGAAW